MGPPPTDPTPTDPSLPTAVPDPTDLKIAYVGGGSRSWMPTLATELAQQSQLSGAVALYDVDHAAAERNARFGERVAAHEDAESDWSYAAVPDRADALRDADVVVLSTQFPIPDAHVVDLEITRDHGIFQPVAVTVGPAGVSWNMRTIPVYREFAAAIREHCPDAWVLNYSNPLTHLTRTLYEEFPEINAVGLCHEVTGARKHLASLAARYYDVPEPSFESIDVRVTGINHFTWIDEATWRGLDLFPVLDYHLDQPDVRREFTTEQLRGDAEIDGEADFNQVAYELYRRFGVFPAAGDRHLVEYAPWFLQGEMPADLHRWGVVRTTTEQRLEHWEEGPKRLERVANGEESVELTPSDEVMADVLRALFGAGTYETNVNLPNRGQAPDLPEGAVVETNARVARDDVTPLVAGELPRPVRNMVTTHVHNQETLVAAAFEGDVDRAFQAFLNDPQVTLQLDRARELFADLVDAHREYLDDWALAESRVLADAECWPG